MREVLYRGKAINRNKGYHRTKYKNGDWVYGLLTRLYDENFQNLPAEMTNEYGVSGIEIDHNTVGQYTGLTDKNGKKIFEGDICDMCILGNVHSMKKITILHNCVGFEPVNPNEEHPDDRCWKCFWDSYGCKLWDTNYFTVIGNIHDNPELLKGGAE